MANNDEVENLFRNLPKSPEFSEIERKRQEKLIRSYVANMKKEEELKATSPLRRFQSQFSFAAGFVVLVAGVSFASSQGIFDSKDELVVSMPTPEPPSSGSEKIGGVEQDSYESGQSTKPKNSENENSAGFEEFESGSTSQLDIDKFINNTGLDYQSDFQQAKQLVKISSSPLSISKLPQAYGKCAIELGINKELLGIDKGKYDGKSVLAFYYGGSRSAASIWIVEKPCIKLEKL